MHKEKDNYTIIWGDPYDHHFVQTVSAHNEQEALNVWQASFTNRTMVYPFSEKECQAIAEGFSDQAELAQLDQEIAEKIGLKPLYNNSKNEPCTNAWYQFTCYSDPSIENPYLLSYVIKNSKEPTKTEDTIFTFVLYDYFGVYVRQQKATTMEEALTCWKEALFAQESSFFMPSGMIKRFKSAISQHATIAACSPVVAHPSVWRWQMIMEEKKLSATLYIVATADQACASLPKKKEAAINLNKDPYAQADELRGHINDDEKHISLLEKAAKKGDPRAYYALGSFYFDEKSKRKDFVKAATLFEKANQANIAEASYKLATCYEEGKGVPPNLKHAYLLSLKSALLGDECAIYDMVRIYFYGIGTKVDKEVAQVWDEYAAALGLLEEV